MQSRGGVPREDIVAARRERRQKAKASRSTAPITPPPRYRRKRDTDGAIAVEEPYISEETAIDPLDAQKAGLHDAALEQGHEEIALNLEDFDPSTSSGQATGSEQGQE